jgi:hypothetical protein
MMSWDWEKTGMSFCKNTVILQKIHNEVTFVVSI